MGFFFWQNNKMTRSGQKKKVTVPWWQFSVGIIFISVTLPEEVILPVANILGPNFTREIFWEGGAVFQESVFRVGATFLFPSEDIYRFCSGNICVRELIHQKYSRSFFFVRSLLLRSNKAIIFVLHGRILFYSKNSANDIFFAIIIFI